LLHWAQHSQNDNPATGEKTVKSSIRLLLVVVFSGGYLALAVLGRGGIGALFAQPALTALTVVLVVIRRGRLTPVEG
jgi:hypothetical protein